MGQVRERESPIPNNLDPSSVEQCAPQHGVFPCAEPKQADRCRSPGEDRPLNSASSGLESAEKCGKGSKARAQPRHDASEQSLDHLGYLTRNRGSSIIRIAIIRKLKIRKATVGNRSVLRRLEDMAR